MKKNSIYFSSSFPFIGCNFVKASLLTKKLFLNIKNLSLLYLRCRVQGPCVIKGELRYKHILKRQNSVFETLCHFV